MTNYQIISDCGHGLLADRLDELYTRTKVWLDSERHEGRQLIAAKFYLTDIANQEPELMRSRLMADTIAGAACTVIQQPPVGGSKVAVLLKTGDEPSPFVLHSLRLTDGEVMNFGSYLQTVMLFDKYKALLKERGLSLERHCVRTWIYVRDIDTNYDGMVKARNDIFRQHGLTADTHFIASTGIGGRSAGKNVSVAIDFLTCPEVKDGDITYLHATDHLNPTHQYGVAFERGTRIDHQGAESTIFISGTASINEKGEVINVGNVEKQTERLLENIGALLNDGGATMEDIRYFIIYLRDIADAPTVDSYMQRAFPRVPRLLTFAKVCRPAWLVEMECVATL